mmetsp:Transcript_44182/g.51781  ORF Transcript_44182/g.51781 Transcript_44182/m.51781 type:complete len:260 (-) Transcript_44182:607-1386(-)
MLSLSHNVSPVVVSLRPTSAIISPATADFTSMRSFACICTMRPTRSVFPLTELYTIVPAFKTPEYTLVKVNEPTNGSVAILKARAEKGSASLDFLFIVSVPSSEIPLIAATSTGLGIKSMTASRSGCTPLFLNAVPVSTGTNSSARVPFLISFLSVSTSGMLPSKYSISASSSCSTASSTSSSRYISAFSFNSSSTRGISLHSASGMRSKLAPRSSPLHTIASMVIKSITPRKSPSEPIGSCKIAGVAPRSSFMVLTQK